jgi:hypothetical protein
VGPIRAAPIPQPRRPDTRAHKLRQQRLVDLDSLICSGSIFVTVKVVFSSGADFAERCVVAATLRVYSRPGRQSMEQTTSPSTKLVGARHAIETVGRNMTASDTPNSPAERKRARRHKVARRLYEQLVVQNPHRVITLRDGVGRVVARHDPRPEQGDPEIASQ